ncbi:MAG: prepilin-type N-terminal cleavage/methylation domain-containing protein, partial [Betaproteobacteria bacterium]|nr:prepilin-type N-terminal cleavage/methylation domain-containing protein [Betaproteobacteria bacterium]
MRPHKRRPHGFTLIELIIVVIVIGIMAAVLAPLAVSSLRAYDAVLGDVVVLDKLRYATERLAREIREVDYVAPPPTGTGTGFGFTSMGNNSMAFTRSTGMPSP